MSKLERSCAFMAHLAQQRAAVVIVAIGYRLGTSDPPVHVRHLLDHQHQLLQGAGQATVLR